MGYGKLEVGQERAGLGLAGLDDDDDDECARGG